MKVRSQLAQVFFIAAVLMVAGVLLVSTRHHTWSVVQYRYVNGCPSGTTCTIGAGQGLTTIPAGDVVLVSAMFAATANSITSVGNLGSMTHCTANSGAPNGTQCSQNLPWWIDHYYTLSSPGGTSSVPITLNAAETAWDVVLFHLHYTGSSAAFDAGSSGTDSACTFCTGISLTPWLTGTNDAIVQFGNPYGLLTAISPAASGGFFTDGIGFAYYTNVVSPPSSGATWASAHVYALGAQINDSNGVLEVVTHAGTSGGSAPAWTTTFNATTNDNTVIWTNTGAAPTWTQSISGAVAISAIAFKEIGAGGGGSHSQMPPVAN